MGQNGHDRLRVLFVDDSKDDVELISRNLRRIWKSVAWYDVQTEAALIIALKRDTYDIVLCDFKMPNLTAVAALGIVQESEQADIPFIIVSGTIKEDSELDVLKKGARDFVPKPRTFDDDDENWQRLVWAIKRELRLEGERMKDRIKLGYSYDMTIQAWGVALEKRDKFTQGHTLRVTDLTLRFARLYSTISHERFLNIYRGALLHDIGKMAIPDSILLKPEMLTAEEREIINTHPALAFEMLSPIPFLKAALNIPYCHHEKWNGMGYPRGLVGEEIPFEARIFTVADVYDAVTSSRPYRESAWEKERALAYIESEKGKSFDPSIVDKFLEMMA